MSDYITIKGREIGKGAPIVCVPVMAPGREEILNDIKYLVDQKVDMVEWRVDAYEGYHSMNAIREMLEAIRPLIRNTIFMFTYRSKNQGGQGDADKSLRLDIHEIAAESKIVDLIDIEYFTENRPVREIRKLQKMGTMVMASHHDFDETPSPEVIRMLLEEEAKSGADMVKLALMANSMEDVMNLFTETYRFHTTYSGIPVITMSMGNIGSFSRFTGEYSGSCISWGAWKWESAPGQLEEEKMRQVIASIHNLLNNEI